HDLIHAPRHYLHGAHADVHLVIGFEKNVLLRSGDQCWVVYIVVAQVTVGIRATDGHGVRGPRHVNPASLGDRLSHRHGRLKRIEIRIFDPATDEDLAALLHRDEITVTDG